MLVKEYFDLLSYSRDKAEFYNYLISEYGLAKVPKYGIDNSQALTNTYHDYIYYCFTKSTRSIFATLELAEKNFPEDSLIILRTIYENYLHIAHTLNDPNKIYEYVVHTIGLSSNMYKFKKNIGGSLNYKKIVNRNTQKEFDYGTSTHTMAKNSFNAIDINVHSTIYRYLSEHIHPNMLASGNYRDKKQAQYSAEPSSLSFEVPFLILYFIYILGDALYYYHTNNNRWNVESLTMTEILEFMSLRNSMRKQLLSSIELLKFGNLSSAYKNSLIERICFEYNNKGVE